MAERSSVSRGLFSDRWFVRTTLICFLTAFLSLIFFILRGHGIFTVRGDFNEQAIPFYMAIKKVLSEGIGSWSWNIDLGTSALQGTGYYGLGSPFYYLIALFPAKAVPYLVGWLYMVKYTCAGCTSYLYVRRFVKRRSGACVAAVLYAFSGFQTTNLIFFIFHDVVALFPLILIGLEKILANKKDRWFFILAVCINAFTNYYFLVQEAVFAVIYFLFRYAWKKGILSFLKDAVNTAVCAITGVAMSAVLFLPQLMYILGNDRAAERVGLSDFWFERWPLLHIIKGWLMPAETMKNLSAIYPEQWNSVAAYLPLVGIVLAIAYIIKKRDWLSHLLIVLMFMAFSPYLSSVFLIFTSAVQRWWFMLLLLLVLASARVLDEPRKYPVFGAGIGLSAALLIFVIYVEYYNRKMDPECTIYYGRRFLLYALIALAGYLFTAYLHKKRRLNPRSILPFVLLFAIGSTVVTLHFYRVSEAQTPAELKEKLSIAAQLEEIDPQYRYNTNDNQYTLAGDVSGIGSFSSTVSTGIIEFDLLFDYYLPYIRMDKSEIPGLPELLGAKYAVVETRKGEVVQQLKSVSGKTWYVTQTDACPIGFMMESYQTKDDLLKLPVEKRGNALLAAAVVKEEADENVIRNYMKKTELKANSMESISKLVKKNTANAVTDFERNKKGFTCIVNAKDNCGVYFTVPYEKGFDAYVDGQRVNIINSGGMMLLPVPAGEHAIEFVYTTPGLLPGILLSILGWAAFIGLIVLNRKQIRFTTSKNRRAA